MSNERRKDAGNAARGNGKKRWLRAAGLLLLAGILCFCGLIGFVVIREKEVNASVEELEKDYDAIIVLGAQVLMNGEPNTQLQWRLDAALEAWRARQVPIVTCGAQGKDEPLPEAEAMKRYLTERGVPGALVLTDPDSYNTNQNLRNAGRLLRETEGIRKVLIVTSDYHLPRAMALARDQGFEASGLGSPCKPEFWIKNHAREALAWVKYWALKVTGGA